MKISLSKMKMLFCVLCTHCITHGAERMKMSRYNIFAEINFGIEADSAEEAEEIYEQLDFWKDNIWATAEEWDHEVQYLGEEDDE